MLAEAEKAYHQIRGRILDGVYPPGHALSERNLASDLGLGRTPVREALVRLQMEGHVAVEARRGNVVRVWTAEEIRDRYDVRMAIESVAIRRISGRLSEAVRGRLFTICDQYERVFDQGDIPLCCRLDAQFHETLVLATGSKEIARAASLMGIYGLLLEGDSAGTMINRQDSTFVREHRTLAQLLAEGRTEQAGALLDTHLTRAVKSMVRFWEERYLQSGAAGAGLTRPTAMEAAAPLGRCLAEAK